MIIRLFGLEIPVGNTIEEGSLMILDSDTEGNTTFQSVDHPSDYHCPSWRAYNQACDEAVATTGKLGTTEKEKETYAAYRADVTERAARRRR